MNVVKHEAASYRVQSESRPADWFAVDLLENETFGSCTCEHFQCRLAPLLKAGRQPINGPCKHIAAARAAFTTDALRRMAQLMTQQTR